MAELMLFTMPSRKLCQTMPVRSAMSAATAAEIMRAIWLGP